MKWIKIFTLLFFLFSLTTCRKDKVSKNVTINGTVINIYSGTPVSGLKVVLHSILNRLKGSYIHIGKEKYTVTSMETSTDANGNFSFTGVEIHSNGDYHYNIFTSSPYANQTSGAPYNDATATINKGNPSANIVLEVRPAITDLNIQMLPSANIIYPDTITVKFKPKYPVDPNTYHNPIFTSTILKSGYPITALYHVPMGWWYITIDKTKNSINSVTKDSLYLEFSSSTTYTFSF